MPNFCIRADGKIPSDPSKLPDKDLVGKLIDQIHKETPEWIDYEGARPEDVRGDWNNSSGGKGWGGSSFIFSQRFEAAATESLGVLTSAKFQSIVRYAKNKDPDVDTWDKAIEIYGQDKPNVPELATAKKALETYKGLASRTQSKCKDEDLKGVLKGLYQADLKLLIEKGARPEQSLVNKILAGSPVGNFFGVEDFYDPSGASQRSRDTIDRLAAAEIAAARSTQEIPRDFREQCIFLAKVFEFSKFHKDVQRGANASVTALRARQSAHAATGNSSTTQNVADINLKKLPYANGNEHNTSIVVDGQPFGFINKLTQYDSMVNFFEATNDQLSHLQPMIRFFKIVPDGTGERGIEFPFDTFASVDDVKEILSRRDKRGFGAGIESFNFSYEGSNPFSVKKSIKASLTIKANNFQELLKERDPGGRPLRYIDLALKTGKTVKDKSNNAELDYRIKAVVGLNNTSAGTTKNFNIENAVKNNFVSLNLTPVTHTFDFDDTGAVVFKVEYYAYIEEFFDKARMNIFANPEINKRTIQRRLALKTQRKSCTEEDQVKSLNEFIEADGENVEKDKIESLQFLTNQLLSNKLVYYLSLTTEEFLDIIRNGPFAKSVTNIESKISLSSTTSAATVSADLAESYNKAAEAAKGEGDADAIKNSFNFSGLDDRQFAFFYLGDLVDLILSKIGDNLEQLVDTSGNLTFKDEYQGLKIDKELFSEEEQILSNSITQFKKMRVVLGPVEIVDHRSGGKVSQHVSLSDLPVSLAYFNEWLTSKLLAKDSAVYPLTQFLNDLINHMVKNFLNDDSCYNYNIKQKVRLFQSTVTSYKQKGASADDLTQQIINNGETRLDIDAKNIERPVLNIGGHRNLAVGYMKPSRENNYFIYYAGRSAPKSLMNGKRQQDEGIGIFHYIMGRDRGIVKTIKLNKTDSPDALKMVRFEQEGYDGLRQLREIYDVDIETFANVHAFPGTYLFVEPRGFSPSMGAFDQEDFDLTDLGIGGYYMIMGSTHQFAPGTMNTSIKAKWVQAVDYVQEQATEGSDSSGNGESQVKKCGVAT
tara:strand:- start:739 stop:3882 length:3144 start_codon:yes stop_codon:yes gene_type:complete